MAKGKKVSEVKVEKVSEVEEVKEVKVEKVEEVKEVKKARLPSLSLSDLHKAYGTIDSQGGTYEDLAAHLGRPLRSVVQRVNVLRKRLKEEHEIKLGPLTRKTGNRRGRAKEDLAEIAAEIKAKQANVASMG